jgi:hypothetical protein
MWAQALVMELVLGTVLELVRVLVRVFLLPKGRNTKTGNLMQSVFQLDPAAHKSP